MKKKICEMCKLEFECKRSENCWCLKINISEELSDYLKSNYSDCLCQNCFEVLVKNFNK